MKNAKMINKRNIHRIDVHREMEMGGLGQCHGNHNRKNTLAGHILVNVEL